MLRNIVHHNVQAQNFCDVHPLKATNGTPWREEVIDQISISLGNSRQHFLSATFIDPALRLGYMGFVKKADDLRFYLAPVKVLRLEARGRIAPLCPIVRSEIRHAIENNLYKSDLIFETALRLFMMHKYSVHAACRFCIYLGLQSRTEHFFLCCHRATRGTAAALLALPCYHVATLFVPILIGMSPPHKYAIVGRSQMQ